MLDRGSVLRGGDCAARLTTAASCASCGRRRSADGGALRRRRPARARCAFHLGQPAHARCEVRRRCVALRRGRRAGGHAARAVGATRDGHHRAVRAGSRRLRRRPSSSFRRREARRHHPRHGDARATSSMMRDMRWRSVRLLATRESRRCRSARTAIRRASRWASRRAPSATRATRKPGSATFCVTMQTPATRPVLGGCMNAMCARQIGLAFARLASRWFRASRESSELLRGNVADGRRARAGCWPISTCSDDAARAALIARCARHAAGCARAGGARVWLFARRTR